MKRAKRLFVIPLCVAAFLFAFFLIGRYGWKLFGFDVCETAVVEQVDVEEDRVRIRGAYPGSFPEGFLGYHAEQVDDVLYVGFKFSGPFGIFETGNFDITIPTDGKIKRLIVKSGEREYVVWPELE